MWYSQGKARASLDVIVCIIIIKTFLTFISWLFDLSKVKRGILKPLAIIVVPRFFQYV